METWSNYGGYGFWCNKACAERKMAAGIPPLGAGRGSKEQEAQADTILAQAALEQAKKEQKGWSPLATAGVIVGSLLAITLMVVVIKKTRK